MGNEQMSSLLLRLAGAYADSGFDKEAERARTINRILGHSNYPLQEVVSFLSQLEKETPNVQLWKAVVILKAVLSGKKTEQDFADQIWKIQGLK